MRDQAIQSLGQSRNPSRVIGSSFHGKRLHDLGLAVDIDACGRLDSSGVVPMMNDTGMLVEAG